TCSSPPTAAPAARSGRGRQVPANRRTPRPPSPPTSPSCTACFRPRISFSSGPGRTAPHRSRPNGSPSPTGAGHAGAEPDRHDEGDGTVPAPSGSALFDGVGELDGPGSRNGQSGGRGGAPFAKPRSARPLLVRPAIDDEQDQRGLSCEIHGTNRNVGKS